jgi:malate dehydrogenase (oxaloacetate-decarboxylating)
MNLNEEALKLHEENKGKLEVVSKTKIKDMHDLAVVYTPGVAEPCRKIHENVEEVYRYTTKGNMVAVVTDGTAVLGLGDIGPEAALPVMEGKAVLFKYFAGVDAFPICLSTKDPEKIIEAVTLIAPGFGGINLEDISAPRCFTIEEQLKKMLNIRVYDDQTGTAVNVCRLLMP